VIGRTARAHTRPHAEADRDRGKARALAARTLGIPLYDHRAEGREGEGRGQRLAFRLDSGDAVILSPDHPLRIVDTPTGPSPRLLVRHGLEAELTRSLYYELAELALASGDNPPGVWSDGAYFALDGG